MHTHTLCKHVIHLTHTVNMNAVLVSLDCDVNVSCVSLQALQGNVEGPKEPSSPLLSGSLDLSPYLRFGCLSCRLLYSKLAHTDKKVRR